MVKINVEGRGKGLDDATADLYTCLQEEAEERGLVASRQELALTYRVSVRTAHGKYVRGENLPALDAAIKTACERARINDINPETHYVRIEAGYDLQKAEAATRGPSGAAPSEYRAGVDLANLL